VHFKNKPNRQL